MVAEKIGFGLISDISSFASSLFLFMIIDGGGGVLGLRGLLRPWPAWAFVYSFL